MDITSVVDESTHTASASYCFNASDLTIGDKELEALSQQLIFWVEGYTQDESET